MSDELKPCAHCGSAAELMCPSGLSWWVQCTNKSCGMATKIAYSDEPVFSAWNNRSAPVPPSQEARDAEVFAPDWANYRQGVEDGKREAESVAIGVSRDAGRWRAVVANLAWSAWTADRSVLIGLSVPKDAGPYNGDKVRDFTETADHFAAILAAKEKK